MIDHETLEKYTIKIKNYSYGKLDMDCLTLSRAIPKYSKCSRSYFNIAILAYHIKDTIDFQGFQKT